MRKVLLYAVLIAMLLFALTSAAASSERANLAERTLRETYAEALYGSAENLQSLVLALEKLQVASGASQCVQLLGVVSRTAHDAHSQLVFLPLSHEAMADTLAYLNTLADTAALLADEVITRGSLSTTALATLAEHLPLCKQLSSQLALARREAAAGTHAYSAAHAFGASASAADRPIEAIGLPDGGIQYPTLAYSGTFSAPEAAAPPRGLPDTLITQEEALAAARDFVGEERVVSVAAAPNTSGTMPAFGVTVQCDDVQLNLEITVQGGKVLWMMPENAAFTQNLTLQQCIDAAADFLRRRGFGDATAVTQQIYADGLCVITFAPLDGNIALYPDILRLQVRMDTGDIVGFEAHEYWQNHTDRSLPAPTLTEAATRAQLSDRLDANKGRLCLIPRGSTERLCWEYAVTYNHAEYRLYLDAFTGAELEIVKLVPLDGGITSA